MPPETVTQTTNTTAKGSDPLSQEQESRLLEEADLVTTATSNIEDRIQQVIDGVERGAAAGTERIELQAGRAITDVRETGARQETAFLEERRGFATNTAALRDLREQTEKRVRDLDQRKQELILANEQGAASRISELQFQALQFEQTARQQAFSNLLGISNLTLQRQGLSLEQARENRLLNEQNFRERQAVAGIGLQFGVPVSEGDTLEDVVAKAAPFASKQQQLQLTKLQAEVNLVKAQTQKALAGDPQISDDPTSILALARAGRVNPAVLGTLTRTPEILASVVNTISTLEKSDVENRASSLRTSGVTKEEALQEVMRDPLVQDKAQALKVVEETFSKKLPEDGLLTTGIPFLDIGETVLGGSEAFGANIIKFFSGVDPREVR